ncbi:MAG: hypothetical protein ACLTIG_04655 [Roseburia hominis]|jgi:hypothetical protein
MRKKIYRVDEGNRVPLKIPLLEGQAHPERETIPRLTVISDRFG